mgnify:CR=1 FL=1
MPVMRNSNFFNCITLFYPDRPNPIFPEITQPSPTWIFAFQHNTIENSDSGSIHLCNMPIQNMSNIFSVLYIILSNILLI